jgi:hypothetical protein
MTTEQSVHLGHDENLKRTLERLQQKIVLLQDRLVLLEEENRSLVESLRERGINVRQKSLIHVQLPPALTHPSPLNDEEMETMSSSERGLFERLLGSAKPMLVYQTNSAADVGFWLWRRRLWLCATESDLLLFAAGRKPLIQKVPFIHIQSRLYNHVTGELVLAPNRKFRVSHVELPPVEAYQVLAQVLEVRVND